MDAVNAAPSEQVDASPKFDLPDMPKLEIPKFDVPDLPKLESISVANGMCSDEMYNTYSVILRSP